jgi:hypothetical protein
LTEADLLTEAWLTVAERWTAAEWLTEEWLKEAWLDEERDPPDLPLCADACCTAKRLTAKIIRSITPVCLIVRIIDCVFMCYNIETSFIPKVYMPVWFLTFLIMQLSASFMPLQHTRLAKV